MTNSPIDPNPTNDRLIASLIAANPAFADTLRLARAASDSFTAINALDPDDETLSALRDMLTDDIDYLRTLEPSEFDDIDAFNRARDLLMPILADIAHTRDYDPDSRHRLSDLALSLSLCPMHFCDYAICFDDDTDECAIIRKYFPSHDT